MRDGQQSSLLNLCHIKTFLGITPIPESGVLKIYSACETGLAPGKSVKVGVRCLVLFLNRFEIGYEMARWFIYSADDVTKAKF